MNDPNIFYGHVFDDEELEPYRQIYDEWDGYQTDPEVEGGERQIFGLKHYPNSDKLLCNYNNSLPRKVQRQLRKSLEQGYTVDAKLSLYGVGGRYDWHHDADPKVKHEKNAAWRRIVSSITYLNDGYEGGETEFLDRTIVPESGKTLIFPSFFTCPHRGCPVKDGVKKILVMHFWV